MGKVIALGIGVLCFCVGLYVYFDYETGWCTRIKQDFRFEYSFLEDSLQ